MAQHEHKPITAMSVKMIAVIKQDKDGGVHGELDSKFFKEPFAFTSLVRMIEMMEATFDTKGFPEKQMLPRSFDSAKKRFRKHELDLHAHAEGLANALNEPNPDGKTCSFEILVRFRKNAEWQGNILWVEKGVTKEFKSIVEMVKLIDTALSE